MNNTENNFFEEYKKLDSLCKDLLNSNQGVSEYIYEMENTPANKSRLVQAWDYDYKMLKHIRWVRNKIAHCEGSSECTKNDIVYVKQFYERIINQEDPFSILYKRTNELSKYAAVHNNKASYREIKYSNHNKTGNIDLFGCFLIIILIIIIFMILWSK